MIRRHTDSRRGCFGLNLRWRECHKTGSGYRDRQQSESVFEISAHVILPDSPPARDVEAQRL
jgi:hypothetical protein